MMSAPLHRVHLVLNSAKLLYLSALEVQAFVFGAARLFEVLGWGWCCRLLILINLHNAPISTWLIDES
jgi:hypothetical protein